MIISCTPSEVVLRQMNMSWGIVPLYMEEKENTDELFDSALIAAKNAGLVKAGDTVVLTAGIPLGIEGKTNMLKLSEIVE